MLALVVVLGVGLYAATRMQETLNFLVGAGIVAAFVVFVAPHAAIFGGH